VEKSLRDTLWWLGTVCRSWEGRLPNSVESPDEVKDLNQQLQSIPLLEVLNRTLPSGAEKEDGWINLGLEISKTEGAGE
jgi:hypothetical protein